MTTAIDKQLRLQELEDAPVDFKCVSHSMNRTVSDLVEKLNTGKLILPDFQRDFVWGRKSIQSFLRSSLNGVPIISIILVSDPADTTRKTYILDGYQRLSSLSLFANNKTHLGKGMTLSKSKFNDLPEGAKQDFLNKDVQVTQIEAARKHWAYLFRTYNRGGSPLNAIEIRRSVYENLDLLYSLMTMARENHEFISIFGKNTRFKGLHVLLRALAMHLMYQDYQKPLEQFLDKFCNFVLDEGTDMSTFVAHLNAIIRALYQNKALGRNSFRQAPSKPINLGLVDCMFHGGLLLLKKDPKMKLADLGAKLQDLYNKMVNDSDNTTMILALSQDTSGRESVISRMALVEELLEV